MVVKAKTIYLSIFVWMVATTCVKMTGTMGEKTIGEKVDEVKADYVDPVGKTAEDMKENYVDPAVKEIKEVPSAFGDMIHRTKEMATHAKDKICEYEESVHEYFKEKTSPKK